MAEWVVLELSPKAEGEDPDCIRTSIRHMIRDAEVYIPVSVTKVGEDRVVNYLVDGYAFIKRAHPDEKYFKLEGSRYVQQVISTITRVPGRYHRTLACASDADINQFRQQIHAEENQGIGVGDMVVVTSGPYRQIQARVIEDIPEREEVSVHIKLRSKEDIVTLPRSFLRLIERAAKSPYLERAQALRGWFDAAKPFLLADPSKFADLINNYAVYEGLERWVTRRSRYAQFFSVLGARLEIDDVVQKYADFHRLDRAVTGLRAMRAVQAAPGDVSRIQEQGALVSRLVGWEGRWKTTFPHFERLRTTLGQAYSLPLDHVQARFLDLVWVEDVVERLGVLKDELDGIERSMMDEPRPVDTVIVDGHNLVFRCALVPGLDTLKDSRGRPTGAILGFLRSLGSFRKKFPGAEMVVTWDGSSNRRKAVFPAYKANRATNGHAALNGAAQFNPVYWLRDSLPSLGVRQAWNPEEEADDVIATWVRKHPASKCVIITTDRDLLQLVSDRVRVLVPGKDTIWDPASVQKEFGVPPERMVDLRALDGDVVDNIPGVPGFGLKKAAKLLRLFGTVDGIYASNFAGVTPAQFKNLSESEKQVRLNVHLMSLHDVPLTVVEPNPDQIVATQRLTDVEVKSETILTAMLSGG